MRTAEAKPPTNSSLDEVVLTREGHAEIEEEHRRLAMVKRPHFSLGTKLQIPAEGAMHGGTVVQLPFLKELP